MISISILFASVGENPNLCQSDSCQGTTTKKKNLLIPILVPVLFVIVIVVVLAALAMMKFKGEKTKGALILNFFFLF